MAFLVRTDDSNDITLQGMRIVRLVGIGYELRTIETAQPIFGRNPNHLVGALLHLIDQAARQIILGRIKQIHFGFSLTDYQTGDCSQDRTSHKAIIQKLLER